MSKRAATEEIHSQPAKVAKTPGAEDVEMTKVDGPGRERARSMSPHFGASEGVDALDIYSSFVKGSLTLEDGTAFEGYSFGAVNSMSGELVFNTGMTGYPEALTDPSYRGQILVLTYPLVGNYGVPGDDKDEHGLPLAFESDNIHVKGLIVSEYSLEHSHWNARRSLAQWLKEHNIPALFGLDTRMLTKMLRDDGAKLAKITFPEESGAHADCAISDPNKRNLVAEVSTKVIRHFNPNGAGPRIVAFDCGIKFNIIRYFINLGVRLALVPYNYDLEQNPDKLEWDGLFISNGPGDPTMAGECVKSIRWAIDGQDKPIFGICFGNQILALAAGAKTYKMKYGNRGMNQPCIDLRTTRCYITSQNHGYAVDSNSLPEGWKTMFMNANDMSNEGIIHTSKKIFSVQFHPEAAGGPYDTDFLFSDFLEMCDTDPRAVKTTVTLVSPTAYIRPVVHKVLLLGSGGLSIGQAGEFDYSGSQAIKALKEQNKEVILINPNIATVQTSKGMADKTYFLPVDAATVIDVIKKERPDSIILSMGGQTALNTGVELTEMGALEKYGVQVLGTPIPAIVMTEDREVFAKMLQSIGESAALSFSATTVAQAIEAAGKVKYPCLVRAAFALGGLGSGFANNESELVALANKAFAVSPQILVDEDLRGWKEVEYEVVRDCRNNCITVCNMENFDPLGIHTGDSIVVAPSQTLSNREYFKLRKCAQKVVRHLGIVGECNIQYALHPESERFCIIEVNARLSRSSALASKATGYPLAYVACKLGLGMDLVSIKNMVTKDTTACFEPSLDYCVVKIPRFDLAKFNRVSNKMGSAMKSVGEVMAIGRRFEETFQKAIRMINPSLAGFEPLPKMSTITGPELEKQLREPDHERVFAVAAALRKGWSVDRIHELTKIDRWYLHKLNHINTMNRALEETSGGVNALKRNHLAALKGFGFSDLQIANGVKNGANELAVRRRRQQLGVVPYVKQIDTLAAEFPAQTNYLYMTYNAKEHDIPFDDNGVMVLGCGPYCIGSSVEFDWCAVSCVRQLRKSGIKAIVVNYNPETVSTDYDESDRLYFEELSFERVLDIYEQEHARGVVVSVGGQIPNNLAMPLHGVGVNIMGTSPENIDRAEDREKFSAMLDDLGVDQPEWKELTIGDPAGMKASCDRMGYPLLVRPSFVLSGAAMRVASTWEELSAFLDQAIGLNPEHPVVVTRFILNAKEIEFDGVASHGKILNYAISEHVENAGVHSGDATLVLPAQHLYVETIRRIKKISSVIAQSLDITGPFNMQFIAKDNFVKVIECNLRASRTFPFVSKTFDFNFISLATKAMLNIPCKPHNISLLDLEYVGVKAPQFSFTRLQGADPTLGVEMSSTGEVACFGKTIHEAYLLALKGTRFKMPTKSHNVLLSIGPSRSKSEFVESAQQLVEMGFNLFATRGTAKVLQEEGNIQNITVLNKPSESNSGSSSSSTSAGGAVDYIQTEKIDLVINITDAFRQQNVSDGYQIRRATVDFGVSLISNLRCAELFVKSLYNVRNGVAAAPSAPGGMSSPRSKEHKKQAEAADVGDPHFPPRHILEYYRTNAFAMGDYA